ncbi:hypothetical protein BCV70DRAFT_199391 [Testicularia cyperi]|uniref:Uncharacterized protein n=1 Tax=Testicularia cyperi TaxID=1882483 RepID=A0A317XSE9_9BASI|nr:hypothetical protein BCV70DRAFT_199391 [Testicularia cyperi]
MVEYPARLRSAVFLGSTAAAHLLARFCVGMRPQRMAHRLCVGRHVQASIASCYLRSHPKQISSPEPER